MCENSDTVKIDKSWKNVLDDEFSKDYMQKLKAFILAQIRAKKIIYPHGSEIFSALNHTPLDKVKVVIFGQDPYHGENQAHGLSFSVKPGVRVPPSLDNIFKEIENDLGFKPPSHGHLLHWASQGVLLLNAVLTVEKGKAGSHHNQGWEIFTDKIVDILNQQKEGLVFLLWGSKAFRKGAKIDVQKHLVLKAPHPSPLSAYRGFFGCGHFSKTNEYLKKRGLGEIDWSLPRTGL